MKIEKTNFEIRVQFFTTLLAFAMMVLLPQSLRAEVTDVKACLALIQTHWSHLNNKPLTGETRHKTQCAADLKLHKDAFVFEAVGDPLEVHFQLGASPRVDQTIQFCKVDAEKIHLVFEQKGREAFDKKEKVQLTLLKRKGTGLSMILSERQVKAFLPTNQSHLICHLQP